ncbi:MAG: hypothetical protein ABEI53_02320 [Candidatus Magasanikbacteria bacterium]
MAHLTKQQTTILSILVLFIIVEIALFMILRSQSPVSKNKNQKNIATTTKEEKGTAKQSTTTKLKEEGFTKSVNKNATETKAQAETNISSDPTGKTELGVFDVVASPQGYKPNKIVIGAGDVVQAKLTSKGGSFDLTVPKLGIELSADKGETEQTSFRVNRPGTYLIECSESCPESGKITAELVVKPQ